jgi:hypothetical protein
MEEESVAAMVKVKVAACSGVFRSFQVAVISIVEHTIHIGRYKKIKDGAAARNGGSRQQQHSNSYLRFSRDEMRQRRGFLL